MRKSLWIMLAVIVVAVSAPNAYADSFTYTYTSTINEFSWTTAAIPGGIVMETTIPGADLAATSNAGPFAGCVTSSAVLDLGGLGGIETIFTGCSLVSSIDFFFAPSDYVIPGTYNSTGETSLVVARAVAAPEPSSVALMLLGVGLVLLLRKRNSRGHQLAA